MDDEFVGVVAMGEGEDKERNVVFTMRAVVGYAAQVQVDPKRVIQSITITPSGRLRKGVVLLFSCCVEQMWRERRVYLPAGATDPFDVNDEFLKAFQGARVWRVQVNGDLS